MTKFPSEEEYEEPCGLWSFALFATGFGAGLALLWRALRSWPALG